MNNWETARYLLDAKKCVDSIIFIDKYITELGHIDIRKNINAKLTEYYLNCCIVLDRAFPKKKKELCENDEIIRHIYYERNKNYAHKDSNYKPVVYDSLSEMVSDLQGQLSHVKDICGKIIPSEMTLDFVPHDRELFRLIEGLTIKKEAEIDLNKYPLRNLLKTGEHSIEKKVFNDTEEIKSIDNGERNDYAVIVDNGINQYEGLQNRQDFCVKVNVLFKFNIWCSLNQESVDKINTLKEIGVVDKYNIFHTELSTNFDIQRKVEEIFENKGAKNDTS